MFDLGRVEKTIMNTIFHSCLMSKHIRCIEQHVQSFGNVYYIRSSETTWW